MTSKDKRYALGIDIGTSKVCVVVFDIDLLGVIATYSAPNTATVSTLASSSLHEQDPEGIWRICVTLIQQIPSSLGKIESISITGQMHGLLILDEQHIPTINFITWRDGRLSKASANLDYCAENGCCIRVGYGASTLLALNESSLLDEESYTVCSITSFIMGRLCGDYRVDETLAASFGIFSLEKSDWNYNQIDELGLNRNLFGPIVPSCTPVAPIDRNVANLLNLCEDVMIYAPLGDNQASVLGSIGFLDAGVINIGTGGQLSIPSAKRKGSKSIEIRPIPGIGFLQTYSSLCGGWAYEYLKDFCKDLLFTFGIRISDREIFSMLDSLVELQDGHENLVVDTRFLGTRENPSQLGSITHIDTRNFKIASLATAFIRGIVQELHHPDVPLMGISFIVASGNAVRKSSVMRRFIENEFGCSCKLPPFTEEACVGSIIACIAHEEGKNRIQQFYFDYFNSNQ